MTIKNIYYNTNVKEMNTNVKEMKSNTDKTSTFINCHN